MSDTSLLFNINARDNTAGALRSAEGNFNHLADGVKKIGAVIAAAFAVDKIAEFAKSSVEAAAEEAKLSRITEAGIKSTGGAANVTAAQIDKLSMAQSNKTGTDIAIIHSGANMLLTFTAIQDGVGKNKDMFERALAASTDMAAAMNNGVVTMDGMKSASIQLGKALADPVKGVATLRRIGVELSPVQQAQIKAFMATKTAAGLQSAQMVILNEVNKEFAGRAEANLDPLTKLRNQFHNISIEVGKLLLPAVEGLATFLSDHLVPAIDDFIANVKHGGGAFKTMRDDVHSVIDAVKKVWPVLVGIGDKIGKELGKIDLSGIGTTIVNDAKSWGTAIINGVKGGLDTGNWSGLGSSIGTGISTALKGATDVGSTIAGWLSAQLGKVDWFSVGMKASSAMATFAGGLLLGLVTYDPTPLFTGLATHWKAAIVGVLILATGGLGKALGPIFERLGRTATVEGERVAPALVRGLAHLGSAGLKALEDAAQFIVKRGGKLLGTLLAKLFPDLARIGAEGMARFGQVIARVQWWKLLIDEAGRKLLALPRLLLVVGTLAIDAFLHAVARAAPAVLAWFQALPGRIGSAIGDLGKTLYGKGLSLIHGLLSAIVDAAKAVWAWFQALPGRILSALPDMGSLLVNAGKSVVQGLISGVQNAIPGLHTVLSGLTSLIPSWKGPAAKDAKLLYRNGALIIQGLIDGFKSKYPAVQLSLGNLTVAIAKNTAAGIKTATDTLVTQAQGMFDALKQKISDARDYQSQMRASFVSGADITQADATQGPQGIIGAMTAQADAAQQFAADITALRKGGLNADSLAQIRDAGASGGLATAQSLLMGQGEIAAVNAQERRITGAGSGLGRREALAQFNIDPEMPNKIAVKIGRQKVIVGFDFSNTGDDAFVAMLRKVIRVKGGNVQAVLGKG